MPTPTLPEFWHLATASGLLDTQQIAPLQDAFGQIRGAAASGNTRTLCEWLIDRRALSRFQCDVLLLGQPGPFRFGDYVLWDRIGQGRLKKLYRAIHAPTGQPVLLKFLSGPAAADPQRLAALKGTADTWSQIDDEHLIGCIEFLDLGTYKFMVTEDREGRTVAERMRSDGRLAPAEACAAVISAATGLSALHGLGLVHGDVRPENVWCGSEGTCAVLGFPLARDPLGPAPTLDTWTADYAAPELENQPVPTPLTDIYALGCTLYELLTGQPPFASGPLHQSLADKINRHATEPIVPVDQSGPMPDGLNRVVSFMMAKNPAVRYQDTASVCAALKPFAAPLAEQAPQQRAGVIHLKQFCRQRSASNKMASGGRKPLVDPPPPVDFPSPAVPSQPLEIPAPPPTVAAATAAPSTAVFPSFATTPSAPPTDFPSWTPANQTAAVSNVAAASTAPQSGSTTPRSRRNLNRWITAGVVAGMALVLVVIGVVQRRQPATPPQSTANVPDKPPAETPPVPNPMPPPADLPERRPAEGIPDDGETLWISPTQGAPPKLRYLASGAQIVMVLRPQSLLNSPRGKEALDAMGPASSALLAWIETQTGLKPANIDRLDIAFYEGYGSQPTVSLVAYAAQRPAEADLVAAWSNPTPTQKSGQRYFLQGELCRYLPPDLKDAIVIAPREQFEEILSAGSAPPVLDPYLQALVDTGDASRHVSIFFTPIYVRAARETLYPSPLPPLREALDWLLGPSEEVQAAALSLELGDPFFAELLIYPARSKKPKLMARDFRDRIDQSSRLIQSHLVSLSISSYSRELLSQLPFMLQSLAQHTRHGADERISVVRAYLPGEAAANLALAADLLLLETAGTSGAPAPPPKPVARTIWDKLKQPVTLSFERDSLENALKQLSTELSVKIEIIGNDLKLDGITKNQPLGLDMKNRPAEEVLGEIMLQANPDRTVKKLSDDVQKLVYVVKPAAAGGEDMILITTRTKAAEHGELPAVFKSAATR